MDQDIQCLWFCRALLIIARFPCSNLDNSQWSDLEATWCSHIEDQYSMFTPRRHSMFIPRRYCMFIPRRSILKCSDVDDTPYSHSENAQVFRCGWYSCSKLHDTVFQPRKHVHIYTYTTCRRHSCVQKWMIYRKHSVFIPRCSDLDTPCSDLVNTIFTSRWCCRSEFRVTVAC